MKSIKNIRLTTSVPISASYIELDAATALTCSCSDYQPINERNYDDFRKSKKHIVGVIVVDVATTRITY